MAGNTTAGSGAGDLFQRKATGLLRGWSVLDGFIYAAFAINLMTLGLWIFSFAPFIPDGSLIYAIILSGLYLVFQAVTYASLIAVMPRDGGGYSGFDPDLARHEDLRPHPEVLLLRRGHRPGDHALPPALQLERGLRQRVQLSCQGALRRGGQRLPADPRG